MLQTEMSCTLSEVESLLLSVVVSQHWLYACEGSGIHKYYPTTQVFHFNTFLVNKMNIMIISFYDNNFDSLITVKLSKLS
jgi:hypothetical protein